jgi:hypothetical protein
VLAVAAVFAATLLGGGVAAAELLESVHASDCNGAGRGCWVLGAGFWVGGWIRIVFWEVGDSLATVRRN